MRGCRFRARRVDAGRHRSEGFMEGPRVCGTSGRAHQGDTALVPGGEVCPGSQCLPSRGRPFAFSATKGHILATECPIPTEGDGENPHPAALSLRAARMSRSCAPRWHRRQSLVEDLAVAILHQRHTGTGRSRGSRRCLTGSRASGKREAPSLRLDGGHLCRPGFICAERRERRFRESPPRMRSSTTPGPLRTLSEAMVSNTPGSGETRDPISFFRYARIFSPSG
jgi:hypothetical protein